MKILIQRVAHATVTVSGRVVGRIRSGVLVFVGVEKGDGDEQAVAAAEKLATLRIFADERGRMNRSVVEVAGSALVVSQFTLVASVTRGRRPSFDAAAAPELARRLVDRVAEELAARNVPCERGEFGAHMDVELRNDGPVTFWLDVPPGAPGFS